MGRIYVDRANGRLERTDVYRVRLILRDGTVIDNLEPRRLFPMSKHDQYITLLDEDEREVAMVKDCAGLDEGSVNALMSCFTEYYMVPVIQRLISSVEKFGSLTWVAQTDHGRVTFRIRNRHSDIKLVYGTNRVLVRDSNDNRYEIKDYTALDAHSRHLLFSYL